MRQGVKNRLPGVSTTHGSQSASSSARNIILNVTEVYAHCYYIKDLGDGLTGSVGEYTYNGMQVAVKFGRPFDPDRHRENAFEHVENEIAIYRKLSRLQGGVVPKVICCGHDNTFTMGGLLLITEKVGHAVERKRNGLFSSGRQLSVSEIAQIQSNAMEGLDAIHACDIMHNDTRIANLRVENIHGIFRVWWIDFGMSLETTDEAAKMRERKEVADMFSNYL